MSTSTAQKMTVATLEGQITSLNSVAALSTNSCIVAESIALANSDVKALIMKKCEAGYIFRNIDCVPQSGISENREVVFEFDCMPETLCFIRPSFMAVVSMVHRYVVTIVDPYIPAEKKAVPNDCSCKGSAEKNGSDHSIDATVRDGKVRVSILGYNIEFPSVPGIPDGTGVQVNLHLCGAYSTKGARAELKVLQQGEWRVVQCYTLAGDCDC